MSNRLAVAILISLLFHLAAICSVTVIFLPDDFKLNVQPVVMFIGSVLTGEIPEARIVRLPEEADVKAVSQLDTAPQMAIAEGKPLIDIDRVVDLDLHQDSFAQSFGMFSGGSLTREIIFRPPFRSYPEWEHQEVRPGTIEFKIFISAEGAVERIVNVRASGNPDIDAALARYLRRLRFAPKSGDAGVWQKVRLRLQYKAASPLEITLESIEG